MSAQQTQQQQELEQATTEQQAPDPIVDPGRRLLEEILDKTKPFVGQINLTNAGGIDFGNFEGVQRYARLLVEAGCVPTQKNDTLSTHVARATMCILLGRSVGLTPEQAVSSIYVVNCRPQLYGDAPLAVCRQHKAWDESGYLEYFEVDGKPYTVPGPNGPLLVEPPPEAFTKDTTACVVQTLRKGASAPKLSRFSIAHAKAAGLFGRNEALYKGYPQRMIRFRARGYCLRDNFGDALKGIGIAELNDEPETEPAKTPTPPAPGRHTLPRKNQTEPTSGTAGEQSPADQKAATEAASTRNGEPQRGNAAVPLDAANGKSSEDQMALADTVDDILQDIDGIGHALDYDNVVVKIEKNAALLGEQAKELKRKANEKIVSIRQAGRKARQPA